MSAIDGSIQKKIHGSGVKLIIEQEDMNDFMKIIEALENSGILLKGVSKTIEKIIEIFILKNNSPFVSCITRINGELIEDADDLDIAIPMYNLLEYSKNYRKTLGSLYNYYRDELNNDDNDNFVNINVVNSEAFKYKNKITGNTYNVDAADQDYDVNKNGTRDLELAIPLKYLGNFWRALNIPLISCEVSL